MWNPSAIRFLLETFLRSDCWGPKIHHSPRYATVDTVALVGVSEEVQSLALPLPMLPYRGNSIKHGNMMLLEMRSATEVLNRHPVMTSLLNHGLLTSSWFSDSNLLRLWALKSSQPLVGLASTLITFPNMNAEEVDGLLVALRSLAKEHAPVIFVQGISRIQSLHQRAEYHSVRCCYGQN